VYVLLKVILCREVANDAQNKTIRVRDVQIDGRARVLYP
jgi:hypothetical protein